MEKLIFLFLLLKCDASFCQLVTHILESQKFGIDSQALMHNIKSVKVGFDHCQESKNKSYVVKKYSQKGFFTEMIYGLPDSNFVHISIQQQENIVKASISGTPLSFYMKSQYNDFSPYRWPDYDFVKNYRTECKINITKEYKLLKDSSVQVETRVNGSFLNSDILEKDIIPNFFSPKRTSSPKEVYTVSYNYKLISSTIDSVSGNLIEKYDWQPGDNIQDLELEFNRNGELITRIKYEYFYSDDGKIANSLKQAFKYNEKGLLVSEMLFKNKMFVCRQDYHYEFW